MRTLKISLLILILPITISAQWYQQNSGLIGPLFGVCFVDANNGWVVGGGVYIGSIGRTTNGGESWIDQSISTQYWSHFWS